MGFPSYRNMHEELVELQLERWIQGRRAREDEMILVDRVWQQFGLVRDIPMSFPQYQRDDMERPLPLPQPTVPTGEEMQDVQTGTGSGGRLSYEPYHLDWGSLN